ncbi:phosphomevalonate kinase [Irineochytrium annulatum]|nr:phosphomevalonate kinase [Irineochytrium annulatum]
MTTISAPGKVLIAGGYLVLDRDYTGLVVGADARFYSTVSPLPTSNRATGSQPRIEVRSPQFTDGSWDYHAILPAQDDAGCCRLEAATAAQKKNYYVECAVVHALTFASMLSPDFSSRLGAGLSIAIKGDNDFYSQRKQLEARNLPLSTASLTSLDPFCPTLTTIADVNKTGLGSSAAMITSLTAALLTFFNITDIPSAAPSSSASTNSVYARGEESSHVIHNLSQFSHCLAQGKVGSGFDVSAAVYGSHTYRRFSPLSISTALELGTRGELAAAALLDAVDPGRAGGKWDNDVRSFSLPRGVKMMLADVAAGSSTVKLVGRVLEWRKAKKEEADELWTRLHQQNRGVEELLRDLDGLSREKPDAYKEALRICSGSLATQWKGNAVVEKLFTVRTGFEAIRASLREMSEKSGAPIEPPSQTELLDACCAVPGVLCAGVPGAGGFDAIFVLVVEETELSTATRRKVEAMWSKSMGSKVGPLLCGESFGGLIKAE